MPIYEYQCNGCGHKFDEIQKHDADPLVDCPDCRAPSLIKLMSAPSFRLKGKGWYETDFKKDNRRNLADESKSDKKAETSDTKAKTAGESKSTDSKSAGAKAGEKSKPAESATKQAPKKKASGSD